MGHKAEYFPEQVWVVFMPHTMDAHKTLFQKLFRWFLNHFHKNFSHVALFKQSRFPGNVIEINCCSDNLIVRELDFMDFFNLISRADVTALNVEVKDGPIKAKGFITCVTTAKHFLGIDKPGIITPYQLYRYLQKTGEEES